MRETILVARDVQWAIGKDDTIPWRAPRDLKLFKERTMGHGVIVGRKTFNAMPVPLVGRRVYVVTSEYRSWQKHYSEKGWNHIIAFSSMEDAVYAAQQEAQPLGQDEFFVIGGQSVYEQRLPYADRVWMTVVNTMIHADAWFPRLSPELWISGERTFLKADKPEHQDCTVVRYDRHRG